VIIGKNSDKIYLICRLSAKISEVEKKLFEKGKYHFKYQWNFIITFHIRIEIEIYDQGNQKLVAFEKN